MPTHCLATGKTFWSQNLFYVFYNFKPGDVNRMEFDGVQEITADSFEDAKEIFLTTKVVNPEEFEINNIMTEKQYWNFLSKK